MNRISRLLCFSHEATLAAAAYTGRRQVSLSTVFAGKSAIDKTNVPTLHESDLEESFIKGSGPGGQSVNKTCSACFLRHRPTGLIVKCHQHRGLEQNRKQARIYMVEKLDQLINGENSVNSQKERITERKTQRKNTKAEKRKLMKENWKSINDDDNASSATGEDPGSEGSHKVT